MDRRAIGNPAWERPPRRNRRAGRARTEQSPRASPDSKETWRKPPGRPTSRRPGDHWRPTVGRSSAGSDKDYREAVASLRGSSSRSCPGRLAERLKIIDEVIEVRDGVEVAGSGPDRHSVRSGRLRRCVEGLEVGLGFARPGRPVGFRLPGRSDALGPSRHPLAAGTTGDPARLRSGRSRRTLKPDLGPVAGPREVPLPGCSGRHSGSSHLNAVPIGDLIERLKRWQAASRVALEVDRLPDAAAATGGIRPGGDRLGDPGRSDRRECGGGPVPGRVLPDAHPRHLPQSS